MAYDAADWIWVCEKGHADDHHYEMGDDGPELCSRCGARTRKIRLDGLARLAVNHGHLLGAILQHRNATETRLRLLDSRGEAARCMLKPDRDLYDLADSIEGTG